MLTPAFFSSSRILSEVAQSFFCLASVRNPERKYVKVYHDFLDNTLLTTEEQMIFITLKSYVDFKEDSGEAYPSMETICRRAKMSEKRARKNINALIKKGIVKKIRRGLTKTNLYTLSDYATMWACDKEEDVAAVARNEGIKPMTPAEHIAELERMGYKVEIKEKEPTSAPAKVTDVSARNQLDTVNTITDPEKSQERYTADQIRQLFSYDVMVTDHPEHKTDIDTVFNILYDVLNRTSPAIRVDGQDRPAMAVTGRLMRLEPADLWHAICKYHEQTGRIKNARAYMLTLLYHAKEQAHLDLANLGHHNGDF